MERRYSSDLSDEEWSEIEADLYRGRGKQGLPPPPDARLLWDALFYITKNGCFWGDLPKDFPPWKRVYNYFSRLKLSGRLEEIMQKVHAKMRIKHFRRVFFRFDKLDSSFLGFLSLAGTLIWLR